MIWITALLPADHPEDYSGVGTGIRLKAHQTEQEAIEDLRGWLAECAGCCVPGSITAIGEAMKAHGHEWQVERFG